MKTRVKIIDEKCGITRVRETSGVRRGDDLFIDRSDLGAPGDIIKVPEFWVEDLEGDAAKTYYASPAVAAPPFVRCCDCPETTTREHAAAHGGRCQRCQAEFEAYSRARAALAEGGGK